MRRARAARRTRKGAAAAEAIGAAERATSGKRAVDYIYRAGAVKTATDSIAAITAPAARRQAAAARTAVAAVATPGYVIVESAVGGGATEGVDAAAQTVRPARAGGAGPIGSHAAGGAVP